MKKVFFLVFVVTLLISGCSPDEVIDEGPFVGGTSGVSLSFVEGAPVSEFSVIEGVPVQIMLKNNGEYDLLADSVEVALYGLSMSDYGLNSNYSVVEGGMIGIKKDFIEEGAEILVNKGIMKYLGSVTTSLDINLKAKVCYPYSAEARISACALSRNIISAGGESVCEISGEKYSSTRVSASPVQITSFTEALSGSNEVMFRIEIENKGFGNVFVDTAECSSLDGTTLDKDKIHYRIEQEDVVCTSFDGIESNEGYLKLTDGKKTLICKMPVEDGSSGYTKELAIYLDFKYVESTSKDLTILEA
jgi:hypothetical protein